MSNEAVKEALPDQEDAASTEDCNDNTVPSPPKTEASETEASETDETSSKTSKTNNANPSTPQDNPTGQLLMNRFSNWGQQAKVTAVTSLFRRSNSSPSTTTRSETSNSQQKTSVFPLQTATLSPVAKEELPSPFFTKTTEETNVIEIVEEDDHIDSRHYRQGDDNVVDTSVGSGSVFTDDSRHSRRRVAALQWAASNVLDSVQQTGYFRGRYNRENSHEPTPPPTTEQPTASPFAKQTASQMARIMSSPHASHIQSLMGKDRPPNEFVMLLGRGMLGVNLKQTYLKHQGVYVDYLVSRGSAERSGVIFVGDALLSVGAVDVRKSNIWTVPQTIASAARPVHLILSTSGTSSDVKMDRVSYLDACIGLLYHYHILDSTHLEPPMQMESTSTDSDIGSGGEDSGQSSSDEDEADRQNDEMQLISPTSFEVPDESKDVGDSPASADNVEVDLLDSIDQFMNPGIPPESLRKCVLQHVAKRCNEMEYEDIQNDLIQLAVNSDSFRATLRNAFLICVVDCRRFPFLSRHFSQISEFEKETDNGTTPNPDRTSDAMLNLFSDMLNYCVFFPLSSTSRRKEIANQIAYKYFLPSKVGKTELVPPTFDFHHVVSDKSLRSLESALKEPESLTKDTFMKFQRAIADSLSYETPFLSFLVSNECARMRAYLRNTAPFVNIPFDRVVKLVTSGDDFGSPQERYFSKNFILYVLTYLLTLTDQESFGENDDLFEQNNATNSRKGNETTGARYKRIEDSAMSLCAYLFIQKRVLPLLHHQLKQQHQTNSPPDDSVVASQDLKRALEQLWEVFIAPVLIDDQSGEHFSKFAHFLSEFSSSSTSAGNVLSINEEMLGMTLELSDELLYDYASKHHSKFQAHKFHEWICEEIAQSRIQNDGSSGLAFPTLPSKCIKRLLRKVQWPNGITPHKPSLHPTTSENEPGTNDYSSNDVNRHNAECAIVFGSKIGTEADQLKRFCCETLVDGAYDALHPAEILPTLESYATVSPNRLKPFHGFNQDSSLCCQMAGWDVSLIDFMIPRADVSSENGQSALYGVSLVFCFQSKSGQPETQRGAPLSDEESSALQVAMDVVDNAKLFRQKLAGPTWTDFAKSETSEWSKPVIGLALVSQRNVIPAMRATLASLLRSFCASNVSRAENIPLLVDILGNFDNQAIEENVLQRILKPFLNLSTAPWLDLPLDAQKDHYVQIAGNQLIDSLPPVPLALLFVAVLLEQKIVLSSSRRSILLSAAIAVSELLKPLKWCHLFVPRVPTALASDLLQYPAPFIIGIPSEDPGMLDLIRDLPDDVTLVDLDVGRVILASSLSNNEEVGSSKFENTQEMTRALRLQVLYLAQSLGSVIGRSLQPDLWLCDNLQQNPSKDAATSRFDRLIRICNSFLGELVAGVSSCCFWIEESAPPGSEKKEPTIVLDENRFFKVKEMRHSGFKPLFFETDKEARSTHLALSVKDFDLILELFLRCQSMNEYIGKRQKSDMAFSF